LIFKKLKEQYVTNVITYRTPGCIWPKLKKVKIAIDKQKGRIYQPVWDVLQTKHDIHDVGQNV
jgi:hypothetical protein